MNIRNSLSNFLLDKNYFITMYEDKLYIYKYFDINKITDNEISLKLENFNLNIQGNNLSILQMSKDEILIAGNIFNIGKKYE